MPQMYGLLRPMHVSVLATCLPLLPEALLKRAHRGSEAAPWAAVHGGRQTSMTNLATIFEVTICAAARGVIAAMHAVQLASHLWVHQGCSAAGAPAHPPFNLRSGAENE